VSGEAPILIYSSTPSEGTVEVAPNGVPLGTGVAPNGEPGIAPNGIPVGSEIAPNGVPLGTGVSPNGEPGIAPNGNPLGPEIAPNGVPVGTGVSPNEAPGSAPNGAPLGPETAPNGSPNVPSHMYPTTPQMEGSGETPIPMAPSAFPSGEMPTNMYPTTPRPLGSGETPIPLPPSGNPSGEVPIQLPEGSATNMYPTTPQPMGSGETPIPMPPSAIPSGQMPVVIPEGSGETPIPMTPSTVPSGEVPVSIPEGSGETPIPMPPSDHPSGQMPISIPEGSGETPMPMSPSAFPSGEMPIVVPEGSGEVPIPMPPSAVPSGEMPILIPGSEETAMPLAPSGIPTGEMPVLIPAEGSGLRLEEETPILIGSVSNGQSTLLVEESAAEDVLPGGPPGVPDRKTTSGVEITTTNDCCPEYSFKGSPDCYEFCELMVLMNGFDMSDFGRVRREEHPRMRRGFAGRVFEDQLLEKVYLGYIDLEVCNTFGKCDAGGIHSLNEALHQLHDDMVEQKTELSTSFKAKFERFRSARKRQVERELEQPSPVGCSLSSPTSGLPSPTWAASCAILSLPAKPSSTEDCTDAFSQVVGPFLTCGNECTTEVSFLALATVMESTTCVSEQAVLAATTIIKSNLSS